jgi:hypothetical protein
VKLHNLLLRRSASQRPAHAAHAAKIKNDCDRRRTRMASNLTS